MDQVSAWDIGPFSKPSEPSYPPASSELLDKEINWPKAAVVLFN